MEKNENKKVISIQLTANLGNYQNVKLLLGIDNIDNERDYEEIEKEIMDSMEKIVPDIIEKCKKVLKEYEEVY